MDGRTKQNLKKEECREKYQIKKKTTLTERNKQGRKDL